MPFAYWVHNLKPFLVEFTEGFGIRYYGLAYIAGFIGAAWMMYRYVKAGRSPFPASAVSDLMTYLVIGVLVGGRLGYFFLYQLDSLRSDPLAVFRVWEGGMASHGGFIGVLLALAWWSRKHRVRLFRVGDVVVSVTPIGLFFGRVANFINGELYGKVASVPWAMIFPQSAPGRPVDMIPPRHPSQLYEAALEGLLLFAYLQLRFWRSNVVRAHPGQLSGEFLIAYAVVRMFGELFREPDAALLFGLSRGTFYSVFLIIAGIGVIALSRRPPLPPADPAIDSKPPVA